MAGLISGPKAPRQPQIVYVPQKTYIPPTTSPIQQVSSGVSNNTPKYTGQSESQGSDDGPTSQNKGGEDAQKKSAEESRAINILASRRGRAGTIKTGFRGILDEKEMIPRRKTLLGE